MPRYDRYEKLRSQISGSVSLGEVSVQWASDSSAVQYFRNGKPYRFDLVNRKESLATGDLEPSEPSAPDSKNRKERPTPERGRQYLISDSPNGLFKAESRDRNLFVSLADGTKEWAVTTDGSPVARVKYGVASWVYGEELNVKEAMWWSPDSTKLAFYRFDESPVKDYFLAVNQTEIQDVLDTEAYPKAGTRNPIVSLYVLDVASRKLTAVDSAFGTKGMGEYIYDVAWSPSGKEILFNRTNRKQDRMELCAADPETGKSRTVVTESQPQSWAENHPLIKFLNDQHRFIWSSERNGFRNLYLYDLDGTFLHSLTDFLFDVDDVVAISPDDATLWVLARSAPNPYLVQLHRISMDGKKNVRLTDPSLSHGVSLSPDFRYFADVAQGLAMPPRTVLRDSEGNEVLELGHSDDTKFKELGLRPLERIEFPSADGKEICYGTLSFPSDFDPSKKYPLLISVYGGPESSGGAERFQTPNPITEMGFLVAWFDGRGTKGRGKAFREAVYGKLGIVEIDDQASGVRELGKRSYVDPNRVGIYGTSYGGYASVMAVLRHPKTFQVACASSPVTDWLNYDTIYTERFLGLPDESDNKAGYEKGSAKTYANQLTGKVMLYFGTADNNVHPANTLQLIKALELAGKRYDLQVGPDRGHTGMNANKMWEYFVTHLILNAPAKDPLKLAWNNRQKRKRVAPN